MLSIFECFSNRDPDAFSKKTFQFVIDLTVESEAV